MFAATTPTKNIVVHELSPTLSSSSSSSEPPPPPPPSPSPSPPACDSSSRNSEPVNNSEDTEAAVPEHLRACTDEELMVQAEATISALQVEYKHAQQLRLDRLAAAESLAAHMELTSVHISTVKERLSRFRHESGRHLAHPYRLPEREVLLSSAQLEVTKNVSVAS
ncbi:hypothetical protein PILCRDRAFT_16632 [Piloderma croceum F 1598]|uniref:Uncharacterized protein n=1 Tax=Piloderma croceum (strain F 1598) TaxID=765440 RepID=A0A0C3ADK2_PILCF|nr:hypothetical protein PILCRDRAFT_16632 [Piloderma croceum F 1598]